MSTIIWPQNQVNINWFYFSWMFFFLLFKQKNIIKSVSIFVLLREVQNLAIVSDNLGLVLQFFFFILQIINFPWTPCSDTSSDKLKLQQQIETFPLHNERILYDAIFHSKNCLFYDKKLRINSAAKRQGWMTSSSILSWS